MTRFLVLLASLAGLSFVASSASAHAGLPDDVLPDLDQVVPSDLGVQSLVIDGRRRFRLGFASASANVGAGPLTLHGHRRSRRVRTMDVDQLVDQASGTARLVRDVGRMSYVVHPDHRHWHLLGFETYELRRPQDARPYVGGEDRKTGFCLGDRYAIPEAADLTGFDPTPLQGDTCGLGRPGLLGLFAGISTGWADRYEAQIEGQYIDITHFASRKYVLVHTVNADGRIVERDYTNNASSVLLSMRWLDGRDQAPQIKVLRRCPASASCRG